MRIVVLWQKLLHMILPEVFNLFNSASSTADLLSSPEAEDDATLGVISSWINIS